MNGNAIKLTDKIVWSAFLLVSFFLYFSGIVCLYTFFRKRFLSDTGALSWYITKSANREQARNTLFQRKTLRSKWIT